MRGDGIPVRRRDLKGAIREPDVNISSHMPSEVFFLPLCSEIVDVLPKPTNLQKRSLSSLRVLVHNHILKQDFGDVLLANATCRTVLGAILPYVGPEVHLRGC